MTCLHEETKRNSNFSTLMSALNGFPSKMILLLVKNSRWKYGPKRGAQKCPNLGPKGQNDVESLGIQIKAFLFLV